MAKNKKKFERINNQEDLQYLINQINIARPFAKKFKFKRRNLFLELLKCLGIEEGSFSEKYFIFDRERNLHISESEFDYVWISTCGLVAQETITDNKTVDAFFSQYTTLSLLIEKSIMTISNERVYDIDSYHFGYLTELARSLFHNMLLYLEMFGKTYLILSGEKPPYSHSVEEIYSLVKEVMFKKGHNNTLLHLIVHDAFEDIVEHISTMPGNFKEHFVKYNDNDNDLTLIVFDKNRLMATKFIIDNCNDFIFGYYHDGNGECKLEPGLLERLISKADNEKKRQDVKEKYGFLKDC